MLIGLLFAIAEAEDRPGTLAATLPFGAATLIEYQARLLQGCGATQLIVVVQRLTPELAGAVSRMARRGLAVDTARDAADVIARMHPLARLVMLADALATTDGVVRRLADGSGDVLLTVPDEDVADPGFERLGGAVRWAGVARLDPARLADAAALPADYDLQSTLLRVAEQAGARHLALPDGERRLGHGVERRGTALEARGRAMLAASLALGAGWFERFVVRPVARRAIPLLARRMASSAGVAAVGAVLALAGVIATAFGLAAPGVLATLAGVIALETAGALALFRDEAAVVTATRRGIATAALLIPAALAWGIGGVAAPLLALGTIVMIGIGERAAGAVRRAAWWASPPALLVPLAVGAIAGVPVAGLASAAGYAAVTLAAAVEALRRRA